MTKTIRAIGAAILTVIWVALTALAWCSPAKETSAAERRPLAQFPTLNGETVSNGKFMTEFEDYTLDQFPGRDLFRQLKALVHYNVMQQQDNNGIYFVDDYAAKLDYPIHDEQVTSALSRLQFLYDSYLKSTGSNVYVSVVPDKGYYIAGQNGFPAMDYEKLFATVKEKTPWATYIDITDSLSIVDYYRTDTHWKQENLLPVAQKLSEAMGASAPKAEDFTARPIDYPFYGVYYGQAALPLKPDQLQVMESELLKDCKVYTYDDNLKKVEVPMYDLSKLDSGDPYNIYLSGARVGMVQIENPNALTDRELIVFRDSFGSSIGPLLAQSYKTVTLIDIREIPAANLKVLARFIGLDFTGKDVLMLYSTTVLNAGSELK